MMTPNLLMEPREGEQCAQPLLTPKRLEDAVPLSKRQARIGQRLLVVNSD